MICITNIWNKLPKHVVEATIRVNSFKNLWTGILETHDITMTTKCKYKQEVEL